MAEIDAAGLAATIITQLSFDAAQVLAWVEAARKHGIDLPVRVGVPGPAGVRRLLAFAARTGVGTSAGIAGRGVEGASVLRPLLLYQRVGGLAADWFESGGQCMWRERRDQLVPVTK